jgi:hypothetical protein
MKAKHEVTSLLLGLATGMASWPKVDDRTPMVQLTKQCSTVDETRVVAERDIEDVGFVGTECTLVHCSLYTGSIYRVLTPKNQVVNLHWICIGF